MSSLQCQSGEDYLCILPVCLVKDPVMLRALQTEEKDSVSKNLQLKNNTRKLDPNSGRSIRKKRH